MPCSGDRMFKGPTSELVASAVLAVWLQASSALGADAERPVRRTTSDGLALSIGFGTQYAFIGTQAGYFHQLGASLFRVAGYASLGYAGPFDFEHTTKLGYCFGAVVSWGDKHRILLDADYGAIAFLAEEYLDTYRSKVFHGPALQVGYEYMTYSGFFLRVELGVSYIVDPVRWASVNRFNPAGTFIGLGFKL